MEEYTHQKLMSVNDIDLINIRRHHAGLSRLVDAADRAEPPPFITSITRPWYRRLQNAIVNWYWYIVVAIKSPFVKTLPPDEVREMQAGVLAINEARISPPRAGDSDAE